MPGKRRAAWKPSDIKVPRDKKPAQAKVPPLDLETFVQVTVGKEVWTMRAQWLVDRLSAAEKVLLDKELAAGRPVQFGAREGRPALKIEPVRISETAL